MEQTAEKLDCFVRVKTPENIEFEYTLPIFGTCEGYVCRYEATQVHMGPKGTTKKTHTENGQCCQIDN